MSRTVTTTFPDGETVLEVYYYTRTRDTTAPDGFKLTTTLTHILTDVPSPNLTPLSRTSDSNSALTTLTTIKNAGTLVEVRYPGGQTSTISTITSSPSKNRSEANANSPSNSKSLSNGAIAGAVVGIVVALLVVIGLLLLLRTRRKRSKGPPEIAGEEPKALEKRTSASGEASKRGNVLPTWKSELSGETQRAELDANNERKRTELDGARLPTELDAAAIGTVERPEAAANERTPYANDETHHKAETVDATKPPPIPYASKPRPG